MSVGTNLLNSQTVAIKFVRRTFWFRLRKGRFDGMTLIFIYRFVLQEPRKSDAPQLRDECRSYRILAGCRECCSLFVRFVSAQAPAWSRRAVAPRSYLLSYYNFFDMLCLHSCSFQLGYRRSITLARKGCTTSSSLIYMGLVWRIFSICVRGSSR